MGFFNVSEGHRHEDLFNLLTTKFEKFDISSKLIGQTYDGASILSEQLNNMQVKVKEIAPQALFIHCYAHRLNLILQDAASQIKECKIFFANLVGISSFFSKSTKRREVLDNVCKRYLPNSSDTRWNFKSRLITTILNNRDNLIEVFDTIVNSEDFQRDHDTIRESVVSKSMLNDFSSLFLLHTFNLIFQHTDIIFSVTENKLSDISYCINIIESLLSTIKKYRIEESYFANIFSDVVDILGPPLKKIKTEGPEDNGNTYFRCVFNEILDLVIYQIDTRFKNFKLLKFFSLLDTTKFKYFERNFPQPAYDLLTSIYPNLFDKTKLQNELRILYSDPNLLGESANETFQNMLNFIYSNALQDDLSEVTKLLSVIVSLPITSVPVERNFCILKRIKNVCRNSINSISNFATIAIEKDLVKSLQKDSKFYEKVIDNFASQKIREMELMYKVL
ncbi:zinc finger MYM-type protein 1-like [Anoplophora glabripennis]|uniref:zinc finger MYM-type protein 1-like n=1 Tax=Anoplophora glabripennis TaxID=217634 RepID=UPI0008737E73|nr:zinc finger MYM-type protein 1-like [Anoplophora glabripennis]